MQPGQTFYFSTAEVAKIDNTEQTECGISIFQSSFNLSVCCGCRQYTDNIPGLRFRSITCIQPCILLWLCYSHSPEIDGLARPTTMTLLIVNLHPSKTHWTLLGIWA